MAVITEQIVISFKWSCPRNKTQQSKNKQTPKSLHSDTYFFQAWYDLNLLQFATSLNKFKQLWSQLVGY